MKSTDNMTFDLTPENKAKKIPVQIGIYSHGLVEIKEGLSKGDTVITTVGPVETEFSIIPIISRYICSAFRACK